MDLHLISCIDIFDILYIFPTNQISLTGIQVNYVRSTQHRVKTVHVSIKEPVLNTVVASSAAPALQVGEAIFVNYQSHVTSIRVLMGNVRVQLRGKCLSRVNVTMFGQDRPARRLIVTRARTVTVARESARATLVSPVLPAS